MVFCSIAFIICLCGKMLARRSTGKRPVPGWPRSDKRRPLPIGPRLYHRLFSQHASAVPQDLAAIAIWKQSWRPAFAVPHIAGIAARSEK
jgi:hypothetical protein